MLEPAPAHLDQALRLVLADVIELRAAAAVDHQAAAAGHEPLNVVPRHGVAAAGALPLDVVDLVE